MQFSLILDPLIETFIKRGIQRISELRLSQNLRECLVRQQIGLLLVVLLVEVLATLSESEDTRTLLINSLVHDDKNLRQVRRYSA